MRLSIKDFETCHTCNPHDVSLSEGLKIAQKMGVSIPKEIIVIGIIVKKTLSFGEKLTPQVTKAIPIATEMILKEIREN